MTETQKRAAASGVPMPETCKALAGALKSKWLMWMGTLEEGYYVDHTDRAWLLANPLYAPQFHELWPLIAHDQTQILLADAGSDIIVGNTHSVIVENGNFAEAAAQYYLLLNPK